MKQEKIPTFRSLAELYKSLGLSIDQDVDCTIHSLKGLHKEFPVKSPLFRANYYTVLLVESGSGRCTMDDLSYETKPFTIYFTNPGHIKGFEVFQEYSGYLITFSEQYLKQYIGENIFNDLPFLLAESISPRYLKPAEFKEYAELGAQMQKEYESGSRYRFKIISNLLMVFLLKVKENFWDSYNPIEEAVNGSRIVTTFKKNLEKHFRDLIRGDSNVLPKVQDFAKLQSLHPGYMSTVIKAKTGKSVNTWISEKTISEAQALLAQSSLSIKEVSYQLAFNEPTHFSKFFKKHTGLTPKEFQNRPLEYSAT